MTISLNNPLGTTRQVTANLRFPENLTVSQDHFSGSLPPDGKLDVKVKVSLKRSAGVFGSSEWLYARTDIEGLPPETLFQNLPIPTQISAQPSDKPLMVMNDRRTLTELFHGDPAHEHHAWKGPQDLAASFWLNLQGNDLVVKVVADDDVHFPQKAADNAVWQGDSVQLFITPLQSKTQFQLEFACLEDGTPYSFLRFHPEEFTANVAKIKLTVKRQDNHTTYEAVIPPEALGVPQDFFHKCFRFNIMVNDCDDGVREGWMAMAPGVGNGVEISRHPVLLFADKP